MNEQEKKALWESWKAAGLSADGAKKVWEKMNDADNEAVEMFLNNLAAGRVTGKGINYKKVFQAIEDFNYRKAADKFQKPAGNVKENPFAACNTTRVAPLTGAPKIPKLTPEEVAAIVEREGEFGEKMDYS